MCVCVDLVTDHITVDEAVINGLKHLFNNEFMAAKSIFEQKADRYVCNFKKEVEEWVLILYRRDPLHALALSSMAFLKGTE